MDRQLLQRITLNPDVYQGKPSIRNTRYTFDLILDLLSVGMTEIEIIENYPCFLKERNF